MSIQAESRIAEDYYVEAYNEMSNMLAGRDSLSIKRAVYLAEWAYLEGKLDYKTDFCDEIDRIKAFICSLYTVNKLHTYKTGMQMAFGASCFSATSHVARYTPLRRRKIGSRKTAKFIYQPIFTVPKSFYNLEIRFIFNSN